MPTDMEGVVEETPLERMSAIAIASPEKAVEPYLAFIGGEVANDDDKKKKEEAIIALSDVYVRLGDADGLTALMNTVKPFLLKISKAKGGQLFKNVLNKFLSMKEATPEQKVTVCEQCIQWAIDQKRTFLRQSLVVTLIGLRLKAEQYQDALTNIAPLLKELKRLDDKALLVEVHLMESQAYYALSNYPKARAALVAGRTTANAIYCPPKMQATLDLQSGIMHAQEGDFQTGFSYFYEAFEGFDSVDAEAAAVRGLKYMLLGRIMLDKAAEVSSIISGKLALKYAGKDLEAMQAVAAASLNRSLEEFEGVVEKYPTELKEDSIINTHLATMYDTLMEQNLMRIVEPFSRVEVSHVAEAINLPATLVEAKLSKMILDKELNGILDQGEGCLEIFEEVSADKTFEAALEVIEDTGKVVDSLYKKAAQIL